MTKINKALVGGGCFWCIEAVFNKIKGVKSAISGYGGGDTPNPTYEDICYRNTNHIELVEINFDPEIISYQEIIELFMTFHDPTTPMRQGADEGYQYQSIIYYFDEEQKKIAEDVFAQFDKKRIYEDQIVTKLEPFKNFYKAEEYHQEYFKKNPNQMYCQINISPKIAKLRKSFSQLLKNT